MTRIVSWGLAILASVTLLACPDKSSAIDADAAAPPTNDAPEGGADATGADARVDASGSSDATADAAPCIGGGFEVPGNGMDDDCDGTADVVAACDNGLSSAPAQTSDYARALGLCRTTTEAATNTWGLVAAEWTRADGTGTPAVDQHAVRSAFGAIAPLEGTAFVVLSTGHAAAPSQTSPSFVAFDPGANNATTSAFPSDWYVANGNKVPNSPGCPAPSGTQAYDPVALKLRIRVPSNAHSFTVRARLLSAEFPEYVCSPYNDFFVALLDSSYAGTHANPADKNLAVYTSGAFSYPLGVNMAYAGTGLFTACVNGKTGCASGATVGAIATCSAAADLVGTGLDTARSGSCDPNSIEGGGTAWLAIAGNVVPGELATLRFALWDTSDATLDTVVLLDKFVWSTAEVTPGATP